MIFTKQYCLISKRNIENLTENFKLNKIKEVQGG